METKPCIGCMAKTIHFQKIIKFTEKCKSPWVEILYPKNGEATPSGLVATGLVNGGDCDAIFYSLDRGWLGRVDGSPAWRIGLSDLSPGTHSLRVIAANGSSYSDWTSVSFQVVEDLPPVNRAPVVVMTQPVDGSFASGSFKVEGVASDDRDVQRVDVRVGDGTWEEADGTGEWSLVVETGELEEGWLTIEARAFDGDLYSDTGSLRIYYSPLTSIDEDPNHLWLAVVIVVVILAAAGIMLMRRASREQ